LWSTQVPSLAVDLGGTFLRCGTSTDAGDITAIEVTKIPNFLDGSRSADIWESIVTSIEAYARRSDMLRPTDPVALAFPGPVIGGRTTISAPTITGDEPMPDLVAILESRMQRPVVVLNDLSAAAWYFSERVNDDRFMVVTVSSGIGAKAFVRTPSSRVFDDVPYAGEIGHCVVDLSPTAPVCDCGASGHLGAIASGRGAERLARRSAETERDLFAASDCVRRYGATSATLDNERHIVPAIRDGDEWAMSVMRRSMEPLARVLSAVVYTLGLERIIVIGGFALSVGDRYVETLRGLMCLRSTGSPFSVGDDEFIVLGDAHPHAALVGAAAYARRLLPA
jgi:glucokinase